MAKIKKAATKVAAKKPAAKKPAAKKAGAKKSAAKKTVKKAAAKKPAAKKAVKKPAAKKTAAKKTAAKKPAAKAKAAPAAKKPAVKPDAAKPAAKPAVKKPAPAKKSGDLPDVKFRNLFDAFAQGKLPFAQGYIVSSFFSENTAYSIYEIVSYAGVKEIFPSDTGLQFVAGGKKLYVLLENDTYAVKYMEPVSRAQGESIPKRFAELEKMIARNQTTIYVAKEPNEISGSFTILKPSSLNFAVIFYDSPDLYKSLGAFFEDSLNRQRKIPQADARKAAELITKTVEKTMSFKGEYQ